MRRQMQKNQKKFVITKKMSTFAVPFEKNGIFYGLLAKKKVH